MHYEKILEKYYNRVIIFPHDLQAHVYGNDTVGSEFFHSRYKILNYVDAKRCIECQLKLFVWQQFCDKLDSLNKDVSLIFIVQVEEHKQLERIQKVNHFEHPIFYDKRGVMDSLNQFPKERNLRTFLLDSLNRIILIGDPLAKKSIEELYLKQISL